MPKHLCRFTLWPSLYGQSPILVKQIKLKSITTPRSIAITASPQYFPKTLHIRHKNAHVTLSSGTWKHFTSTEGWLVAAGAAAGGCGSADQDAGPAAAAHGLQAAACPRHPAIPTVGSPAAWQQAVAHSLGTASRGWVAPRNQKLSAVIQPWHTTYAEKGTRHWLPLRSTGHTISRKWQELTWNPPW